MSEELPMAREVVVPGEVLSEDPRMLPGKGAIKDGNKIISIYIGLKDIRGKYVNVVPLRGVYVPEIGDIIIGKISDKSIIKYFVDINSYCDAILKPIDMIEREPFIYPPRRGLHPRGRNSRDSNAMSMFEVGDLIKCRIIAADRVSNPVVTTLGEGLGKITDGVVIQIDPPKIPRIIGKKGSMIKLLKNLTKCTLFISKNGRIWIKGRTEKHEKLCIDAILKIERESHTTGLTDRIQYFIEEEKRKRGIY